LERELSYENGNRRISGLSATQVNDHVVQLNWKSADTSDSSELAIEIRRSNDEFFKTISESLSSRQTSYSYDGIIPGTTYYFRVRRLNSMGTRDISIPLKFIAEFPAPKLAPIEIISDYSVRLTWDSPLKYAKQLEIERQNRGLFKIVATVPFDESFWIDDQLDANNEYQYRIRAKGDMYHSKFSEVRSVKTYIPAPRNLEAVIIDGDKVKLTWEDSSGWANRFVLLRRTINKRFEQVAVIENSLGNYIDSGLQYNTDYLYKLMSRSERNDSPFAEPVHVNIKVNRMESPRAKFLDGDSLLISWDHPCGFVQKYNIYRSVKDNPDTRTLISSFPGSVNSYSDKNLDLGVEYVYHLVPVFSGDIPDISSTFDYQIPGPTEGMEYVPAGDVSVDPGELARWLDEIPPEKPIKAFYISRNEISNREYFQFLMETGHKQPPDPKFIDMLDYYHGYPNYPIIMVDWYDAADYCNWLSVRLGLRPIYNSDYKMNPEGNGYHLPTEDQYNRIYQVIYGKEMLVDKQNISGNFFGSKDGYSFTSPVGMFADISSTLTVNNLLGNVAEWTQDMYSSNNNSVNDSVKLMKIKGGSWKTWREDVNPGFSTGMDMISKYNHVGFRVILEADKTATPEP